MSRPLVRDIVYLIERRATGERVTFLGARRGIPRGWRIVQCLGAGMAGDGSGLAYS